MMNDCEHILLLADIHANEAALAKAVGDARQRYREHGPLKIWFMGDLFGRGPRPASTWRRLMDYKPEVVIAGNHDWGLIGRQKNIQVYGEWTGPFKGFEWKIILKHREELGLLGLLTLDGDQEPRGGQVFEYLKDLPVVCSPRPGIYLVHGGWETQLDEHPSQSKRSLDNLVWDYVKEPIHARNTLNMLQWLYKHPHQTPGLLVSGNSLEMPHVVLVAHYHLRTLYSGALDKSEWKNPVKLDYTYQLYPQPERPVLISPGSVGFPREHNDRDASYAVLCLKDQTVRSVVFHKVPFDHEAVQVEMKEKEYPQEVIRYL